MTHVLILCRSLTYAQRAAQILTNAGISAYLVRVPKLLATEGCAHGVKISQQSHVKAMELLKREKMPIRGVFAQGEDGDYTQVDV